MARTPLTPAEREARRRERSRRSFSDAAYKHYDPSTEGFGSFEEWMRAAESLASGRGTYTRIEGRKSQPRQARELGVLGLHEMPSTVDGLKSAFRKAAFRTHPDHGGTEVAFRAVTDAFQLLLEFY